MYLYNAMETTGAVSSEEYGDDLSGGDAAQ
jgi:hypothetical protein